MNENIKKPNPGDTIELYRTGGNSIDYTPADLAERQAIEDDKDGAAPPPIRVFSLPAFLVIAALIAIVIAIVLAVRL